MPPVTKAGGSAFRKDVAFAETKDSDEYELEAAGIVMVPDKADLQRDFAREETIREFADQFATFEEAGQAGGGIMHAVWPDGWMELTRNEVLDEAEEIGGQTVEAGAWVQRWGVTNDALAGLIDDGILGGYSIGAIQVDWDGPYEQDEADDVDTSEVPDDDLVWELTDGIVREVSAVDIPAVPDAEILEAKADADKRLAEHVGNQDAFIEEAMDRGHSEAEAERLWDVLNDAVEADGSAEPGKQSRLEQAAKSFLSVLTRSDDDDSSEAPGSYVAETSDEDPRQAAKAGQTLSASNQEAAMAAIDANLDMLEDAGVDHGMTRFTDRDEVDFDLSEYDAREWTGDNGDGEDDEDSTDESAVNNATGGDTPDDDTTMTDDPDGGDGDKSLAEQNAEQITELTQAVESLTETLSGPEQKTAEIEIDGEAYEVPEDAAKAALGVDEDAGVGVAEAIESLKDEVEAQQARLDAINRQSGVGSTQLENAADEQDEDDSGLKGLGEALS